MKLAKDNPDMVIDPSHIIHRDGKTLYGGFYTQQEMKGRGGLCLAKHIDIIPKLICPAT
jgi:hexosaminidase